VGVRGGRETGIGMGGSGVLVGFDGFGPLLHEGLSDFEEVGSGVGCFDAFDCVS